MAFSLRDVGSTGFKRTASAPRSRSSSITRLPNAEPFGRSNSMTGALPAAEPFSRSNSIPRLRLNSSVGSTTPRSKDGEPQRPYYGCSPTAQARTPRSEEKVRSTSIPRLRLNGGMDSQGGRSTNSSHGGASDDRQRRAGSVTPPYVEMVGGGGSTSSRHHPPVRRSCEPSDTPKEDPTPQIARGEQQSARGGHERRAEKQDKEHWTEGHHTPSQQQERRGESRYDPASPTTLFAALQTSTQAHYQALQMQLNETQAKMQVQLQDQIDRLRKELEEQIHRHDGLATRFWELEGKQSSDSAKQCDQGRSSINYDELNFAAEKQEFRTSSASRAGHAAKASAEADQLCDELDRAQATNDNAQQTLEEARQVAGAISAHLSSVRKECICPISHELLTYPVVAADGHSYDRDAIERWLTFHATSPMTGLVLPNRNLYPNIVVQRMSRLFKESGRILGEGGGKDDENGDGSPPLSPQDPPPAQGALLTALLGDNIKDALYLLKYRSLPGLNARHASNGWTSLLIASWKGFTDVCQVLLRRPDFTEVNAKTGAGSTALHFAATHGRADICRAILARADFREVGATITNTVEDGSSVQTSPGEMVQMRRGDTARSIAVRYGHNSITRAIDDVVRRR